MCWLEIRGYPCLERKNRNSRSLRVCRISFVQTGGRIGLEHKAEELLLLIDYSVFKGSFVTQGGKRAFSICSQCWWNEAILESTSHILNAL
jgi:hypothetical protein